MSGSEANQVRSHARGIRLRDNLGFIQSVLNPMRPNLVQPTAGLHGMNTFLQNIKYNVTHVIKAKQTTASRAALAVDTNPGGNTLTLNDMPETDTGIILHLPQEGVDAIFHQGLVPGVPGGQVAVRKAQTAWGVQASANGLNLQGHVFLQPAPASATYANAVNPAWALEYNGPLFLPKIGDGAVIKVSPGLEKDFSRTRLTQGRFDVYGSTIAAGQFELSGTLSTTAVADTRDLVKSADGAGVQAYDIADMEQQAMSSKDALTNIPVTEGVVSLVGPDFAYEFSAPAQRLTDTIDGELAKFEVTSFRNPILIDATPATNNTQPPLQVFTSWVTPHRTRFWMQHGAEGTATVPPSTWYNVFETKAINETGSLDIQLEIRWTCHDDSATTTLSNDSGQLSATFTHIYACIDANNLVRYNVKSEVRKDFKTFKEESWARTWTANSAVPAATAEPQTPPWVCMVEPRLTRNSYNSGDGGKYLGTFISVTYNHVSLGTPTQALIVNLLSSPILTVRARNIDKHGRRGPAHIVRYDNVSVGQTLQLQGKLAVQCVAQGDLATFLQAQMAQGNSSADDYALELLHVLYNCDPRIRRFYTKKYYEEEVIPWVDSLRPDTLLWGTTNGQEKVTTAMEASGLFSGLGNMVGGIVGGPIGGALGGGLGNIADAAIFGASGCYDKQQAAGMFGAAGSRRARLL